MHAFTQTNDVGESMYAAERQKKLNKWRAAEKQKEALWWKTQIRKLHCTVSLVVGIFWQNMCYNNSKNNKSIVKNITTHTELLFIP